MHNFNHEEITDYQNQGTFHKITNTQQCQSNEKQRRTKELLQIGED